MKILFLDDDPTRHKRFRAKHITDDITAVWNYDEAVQALESQVFDEAHLDHDLSEEAAWGKPKSGEKTGTDVAEYIAAMTEDKSPKKVIIHSFNAYGARRMKLILERAGMEVIVKPFDC